MKKEEILDRYYTKKGERYMKEDGHDGLPLRTAQMIRDDWKEREVEWTWKRFPSHDLVVRQTKQVPFSHFSFSHAQPPPLLVLK